MEDTLSFRDVWSRLDWPTRSLPFVFVAFFVVMAFAPAKPKPVAYDARAVCDFVLATELDAPSLRFVRYDGFTFGYRTDSHFYECDIIGGTLDWATSSQLGLDGDRTKYRISATPETVTIIREFEGVKEIGVPPERTVWTIPNK